MMRSRHSISLARRVVPTLLVLSALTLSGCQEQDPPQRPSVRPWDTYVGAAERFIRAHHAYDMAIIKDAARYATDVISNSPITPTHFRRISSHRPRTWKPLYMFAETPEGAYLSQQDKTYLERIQDQLEKDRFAASKKVREEVEALQQRKEPGRSEFSADALGREFTSIAELVRAVSTIEVRDLERFSVALREALQSKPLKAAVRVEFFERPHTYRATYEENKEAIADAALAASAAFVRDWAARTRTRATTSLDLFFATEAMFGLDGMV
jgi:hypothetical protein